jgi:hypothetical protein
MRLVRLKLRGCPFWNMPPIRLNEENNVSPLLDIDKLTENQREVIDKSDAIGDIMILAADGTRIHGGLEHVNIIDGSDCISVADIEEEEIMPDIVSVTVSEDEPEEVEEPPQTEPTEEEKMKMANEARILLNRNGNTIKKMIASMEKTDSNLMLLHVCLTAESNGKAREGVLFAIQQAISEH